ncbi:hypothetical protein XELAEV_18014680mg [Xenopus laevis]|uniref:Uncharacterized protein n=1 Tax=Xenopus laevis TaxID=8355 RepID=A0A974DIB4_XENLA|nr:hypothetical protein XELAEV_18014680mg [Xenopus laevis]
MARTPERDNHKYRQTSRKKKGRLPRAAPNLDVPEVLELDYPTCLLQWGLGACLEVLAGERSYSYTLDRRSVLLYRGQPSSSTERAASGGTHMER